MKSILTICFMALLLCGCSVASAQENTVSKSPVVIELFTSQGDINSPPAEKLLNEILKESGGAAGGIYPLVMHVDFWNRYGWKDPFSLFRFTNRLHNYTSVLGLKETYTPLMIINGNQITDTGDKQKIKAAIDAEQSKPAGYSIDFSYTVFDDTLDVSYTISKELPRNKAGANHYLNIAITESGLITQVTAGDNKGKSLNGESVVKLFSTTNLSRRNGVVRIPLKGFKLNDKMNVVAFVQQKNNKKIIAASNRKTVK